MLCYKCQWGGEPGEVRACCYPGLDEQEAEKAPTQATISGYCGGYTARNNAPSTPPPQATPVAIETEHPEIRVKIDMPETLLTLFRLLRKYIRITGVTITIKL